MASVVSPAAADPLAAAPGPRRRGRPRKHPVAADVPGGPVSPPLTALAPRRRGRPRKHPVAADAPGSPVSPLAAEALGSLVSPLAALGPRRPSQPPKDPVAAEAPGSPVSPLAAALGPRRRGRPPKDPVAAEAPGSPVFPLEAEPGGEYERERAARIRENMERMQKLGILDLAHTLAQSGGRAKRRRPVEPGSVAAARVKPAAQAPSRRSLRLKSLGPVSYYEIKPKKEKHSEGGEIVIEEGAKEEIYTKEHEKLLGTCNTPWTLFVDGFGEDGKRIYDQVRGQTCHQCRQKTLGHHTSCCKCQIVQGQFCGDCLYMRYGENVLEAKKNPNWICPVCRGICNCSICRTKKGWLPTGCVYRKVVRLGYKSVAHYLIATQQASANSEDSSSANLNKVASDKPETSCILDHDGESSSEAMQNKATCLQVKKDSDVHRDDSTSESVVTSDSQNDQASKDAGCLTPVSKPTSRKRKYAEGSPDCVASRLRSRCKMP